MQKRSLFHIHSDFLSNKAGTKINPQTSEFLGIKNFYPRGCDFYWNGSAGKPAPIALQMFREYKTVDEACRGCTKKKCQVRLAENPNLKFIKNTVKK